MNQIKIKENHQLFYTNINRSIRLFLILPSMRTFAQRRKSTQSSSKLYFCLQSSTFKKDSSDLDLLSNELNKIQNKKTNDKSLIKKNQEKPEKSESKLEHIKSVQDFSMDWSTVNSEIKQEDQQDIYMSLKTEYPKSSIVQKKQFENNNTSFLVKSKQVENVNQDTVKSFLKQPYQQIKKQTGLKFAIITPRQPKTANNLNAVKATQMISRRQKEKITIRLKGLIQLVHCTQIAADNLTEILVTIDKLGEKIKKF